MVVDGYRKLRQDRGSIPRTSTNSRPSLAVVGTRPHEEKDLVGSLAPNHIELNLSFRGVTPHSPPCTGDILYGAPVLDGARSACALRLTPNRFRGADCLAESPAQSKPPLSLTERSKPPLYLRRPKEARYLLWASAPSLTHPHPAPLSPPWHNRPFGGSLSTRRVFPNPDRIR